jgi:outer membrane protein OmpA-like peptidoglycan-associated protein
MNRLRIGILVVHILLIALSCNAADNTVPLPNPKKYCNSSTTFLFDIDKGNLSGKYVVQIDQVGLIMQIHPTTSAIIVGYADDKYFSPYHTGEIVNFFDDMELSKRRAEGVINYLARKYNISISRFTAKWYGDTFRVTDVGSLLERAENRRVIVILDCQFLK